MEAEPMIPGPKCPTGVNPHGVATGSGRGSSRGLRCGVWAAPLGAAGGWGGAPKGRRPERSEFDGRQGEGGAQSTTSPPGPPPVPDAGDVHHASLTPSFPSNGPMPRDQSPPPPGGLKGRGVLENLVSQYARGRRWWIGDEPERVGRPT